MSKVIEGKFAAVIVNTCIDHKLNEEEYMSVLESLTEYKKVSPVAFMIISMGKCLIESM